MRHRFRDHGNGKEFFDELVPFKSAIDNLPPARRTALDDAGDDAGRMRAAREKRERKAAKAIARRKDHE